jgi:DNA polymerase-3 subunit gamma/tau
VADAEAIEIPDEASALIARSATGSFRDALGTLEQLELALVKAAKPEHDASLRALMARLERVESGRPAAAAPAPVRRPEVPATPAARAAQEPVPQPAAASEPAPPSQPPASRPVAEAPAVVVASAEVDGAPPVTAVAVVEPNGRVSEPEVRVGLELDLPGVTDLWPAVLADAQERSPMLHALMANARPSALDRGELTLSWAESAEFYKRKAEDPACREQIATAIRTVTGSSLRLAFALADDHAHGQNADVPALSEDELIDTFMREFDAEELPAEEES